jgi:predicted PurR-regulated permease PerM
MPKSLANTTQTRALVVLSSTFVAVVSIMALYWAQVVFIPFAMAIFLSFLLSATVSALDRIGFGRIAAVIIVVTATVLLVGGTAWLVTRQMTNLIAELPKYNDNIIAKVRTIQQWGRTSSAGGLNQIVEGVNQELNGKPDEAKDLQKGDTPEAVSPSKPVAVTLKPDSPAWLTQVPAYLSPAFDLLGGLALAVVLSVFILLKREDLRNRFIRLVGKGNMTATTKAVDEAAVRISRFLLMQLIVNVTYGLVLGVGLHLIGLDYALLWGLLAAVLRYIPYVGAWIAALPPIVLSLAMFEGWQQPLTVIILFLVLELFSNNVMEPWLYGQSAGVSEVALLVSAAFWAFLWGPIGMVLSAPLTVCLVVMGRYVPRLGFLDVLLGDEPALDPEVTFYQRLLAQDREEATELVQKYIKENPPEQVFDALLVPALARSKRDRERGELSEQDQQVLFEAMREVVAETLDVDQDSDPTEVKSPRAPEKNGGKAIPIRIIGCPAHDEEDTLALTFLKRMLDPEKWDLEVVGEEVLTGELLELIAEKTPEAVCIGSVVPGGLTHARHLCRKLRHRFPEMKIIVGRWGLRGNRNLSESELRSAGANQFATTLQEMQLQLSSLLPVLESRPTPPKRARRPRSSNRKEWA